MRGPTMQIVLCSDNRVLAERLRLALGTEYTTCCISTEEQLFELLAVGEIAAIVLDAVIVDHASALCMRLRTNTNVPLLAIARGSDVTGRVHLLEAGADDVLPGRSRWWNSWRACMRSCAGSRHG